MYQALPILSGESLGMRLGVHQTVVDFDSNVTQLITKFMLQLEMVAE